MDNFDMAVAVKTDAISRSALRETLNKFKLSDDCMKHEWAIQAADDVAKYTIAAIKAAPALDVAPVVHARWRWRNGHYECTACGGNRFHDLALGCDASYCPRCGARMDGEENE